MILRLKTNFYDNNTLRVSFAVIKMIRISPLINNRAQKAKIGMFVVTKGNRSVTVNFLFTHSFLITEC